jgi:hypothetical protein
VTVPGLPRSDAPPFHTLTVRPAIGFGDAEPDLSGSIFNRSDFEAAVEVWQNVFSRLDASWPSVNRGWLCSRWLDPNKPSVLFLINLARTLNGVVSTCTDQSSERFWDKLRKLLKARKESEAVEIITEFEVMAIFSGAVRLVAIEPLVPRESYRSPKQPASPDFAIRLPSGGDVVVEVTTNYSAIIDKWQHAVDEIRDVLANVVDRNKLMRDVQLDLPFRISGTTIRDMTSAAMVTKFVNHESGHHEIFLGHAAARVTWRPGLVLQPGSKLPPDARTAAIASEGGVQTLFGISTRPTLESEEVFIEDMLTSLRNTLDKKRKQYRRAGWRGQTIVVMRLGHHRIDPLLVTNLLRQRIFPNRKYAFLTGVGLYLPQQTFNRGDSASSIHVILNPASEFPAHHELLKVING